MMTKPAFSTIMQIDKINLAELPLFHRSPLSKISLEGTCPIHQGCGKGPFITPSSLLKNGVARQKIFTFQKKKPTYARRANTQKKSNCVELRDQFVQIATIPIKQRPDLGSFRGKHIHPLNNNIEEQIAARLI